MPESIQNLFPESIQIVLYILLTVFGFVLLIKGADFFVDGASGIASRFGIPQIVIGLTVVAFGTSLPEAAVSITAAFEQNTGIAIGNVVGSNILNILIILGLTACIIPLTVQKNTLRFEIPFVIFVTAVLVAFGIFAGELALFAGIVLIVLFALFFVYLIRISKDEANGAADEPSVEEPKKVQPIWKLLILTVAGLAAIVLGSNCAVDGATFIAQKIGISDRFIGLTVVSLGTSLPELVTTVVAGNKGNSDIAIGNIVGSNIFNILFVLGLTSLICPVPYDPKFIVDGAVAIGAAVMLFVCILLNKQKKLGRLAGALMLTGYAGYFAYLVMFQ